jgi:two-component system, cell cycle response regulator
MRVLIADDDKVSRRMLANMLASWGYEVLGAEDGTEAWRLISEPDPPRLAILDWMMPGMTGPVLCRKLRALRSEPYTYVLLLTARTNKEDVVEGMNSGADDYVTKPFDTQELKVRVRAGRRIVDLQSELVAAREALREQATRDPLTCIWNRYAIFDTLHREAGRASREGSPLAVIIADLDHFKKVNDTYGHMAGDAVLREAARRMQACLRVYDHVGRYGGEEFLIVMPGSTAADAIQLAERLRCALANEPATAGNACLKITASFGVAAVNRTALVSPELLIRLADGALYRAKAEGRNCVECAAEGERETPTELAKLSAAVGPPGNG